MQLCYKYAKKEDANLLIDIYNKSFYEDYLKYGECPGYGRTKKQMELSIENFPKKIIFSDNYPVGVISVENKGSGEYYLGCLCVIPEYQNKGIGAQVVKYLLENCTDWKKITLVTPADKESNIYFYTKKCGFIIEGTELDRNVKVVRFLLKR